MSDDPHPISVVDARREIASLRDLLEEKITALEKVITTRLDAMDRALVLATAQAGPDINQLSLTMEQIQNRFADRLAFYELDRSEILRRLAEIEHILKECAHAK